MLEFFWNLGSFIVALGILVAVHEYGHFWVARKAGVKVLRFSIGFGKPLVRWHDKLGTEYVIAAIPLGGYVRMLDERVDEVEASEQHLSFNNKPVLSRIAISAAGPLANFIFAIFALALMYMVGVQNAKPIVGGVTTNSIAELAQVQSGDRIISVDEQLVQSWQEVTFALMSGLGESEVILKVQDSKGQLALRQLDTRQWRLDEQDVPPLTSVGIEPYRPNLKLEIAQVAKGSAAEAGGLEVGDKLLRYNNESLDSWEQFVQLVQTSAQKRSHLVVQRAGEEIDLYPTPQGREDSAGVLTGYLGVVPVLEPWPEGYIETRQYGVFDSIVLGVKKTYDLTALSFEMIGNLLTGQVSVKNLSGPVGIAVGAGNSVSYGFVAFLGFLALISVNLGVFNLLPLPVLDGGHLMYYFIELIRKKPVSEKTQELGYKVGAVVLLALTCFALLNDVSRL
ncbi:sigma E protease regulator RseP [Pseudoalteromonas sp. R3]|uniref:sigma E protease regulator RseP n=1 Tax=Pseudoalteromonas sp. R3 TaxID=1709477 RepID=UPI0006B4C3E4|nr:sigma E protease regulator RseP [Pseudoalteromonas sp. R3]AZZ98901.1 sigma E protease regulator RseP [Pseudoalteromonas sp. R3]